MFRKLLLSCCLFYFYSCGNAQPDQQSLFEKASQELNTSRDVSKLLTNKDYISLHPLTFFRDLIRDRASTNILSIAADDEPGKKIQVNCLVTDREGNPISDALVYLYQTDSKGWYAADAPHILQNNGDVSHARLFGYVKTDQSGKFVLHTIKPSGYPNSDLPAHIHVHVTKNGWSNFVNEFLFDDDPRLVGDIRKMAVQNRFMISKPEKVGGSFEQQFSYNIFITK